MLALQASDLGELVKASGENSIQWSKKLNASLTITDLFAILLVEPD